ncbi:uncharacterized protein LOC110978491 [Acanthaster planci]|uniref:Uncharacterized protein LOC110978491 n=1 Tax=Acanthaster planci TaxID=133434 RepID=A0A8B7Y7M6_ACAPL|nr:uncharacterized protein LOC110978491 [Acanthaster planci]
MECHQLDVEILQQRAISRLLDDDDARLVTDFDKKVASELSRKRKLEKNLKEKRSHLENLKEKVPLRLLDNLDNYTGNELVNRVNILRADIAETEHSDEKAEFEFATGPIASSLNDLLKKHKVCRQAYHGKFFVGNHVNTCFQKPVIEDPTSEPRRIVNGLPLDTLTIAASEQITRKAAEIGQ